MVFKRFLRVLENSRGPGRSPVGNNFDPTCPIPIDRVLFSCSSTCSCFKRVLLFTVASSWKVPSSACPRATRHPLPSSLLLPVGLQACLAHPVRTLVRNTFTPLSLSSLGASQFPNVSQKPMGKTNHRLPVDKPGFHGENQPPPPNGQTRFFVSSYLTLSGMKWLCFVLSLKFFSSLASKALVCPVLLLFEKK